MRKPLSLGMLIAVLSATNACTKTQAMLAPTPTPVNVMTRLDLAYEINLPTVAMAQSLIAQYPNGIRMAPLYAQQEWNYIQVYGGANVYYGPTAPPEGMYRGVGIVVAPVQVASMAVFPASLWPVLGGGSNTEYAWLGRFVYAAVRKTP